MRLLLALIIGLVLAPLVGCGTSRLPAGGSAGGAASLDLAGSWRFLPADEAGAWRPDHDDSGWEELQVPAGWGRQGHEGLVGFAWYRLTLGPDDLSRLSAEARQRPAVALGKVSASYELFADGRSLGGLGAFPPEPELVYDRHAVLRVPVELLADDELVLALRVWSPEELRSFENGPYEGVFRFGDEVALTRAELSSELPELFLAVLFALVGAYHLFLFWRGYRDRTYLWFGVAAFDVALYTFLRTQWKYTLGEHFLVYKELEYLAIFSLPALILPVLWRLFDRPMSRLLRTACFGSAALGLLVAATPGLRLNLLALAPWQIFALGLLLVVAVVVATEAWRGQPEARLIAAGAGLMVLAQLNDVFVDRGLFATPRLTPFGFGALVLSFAASLAGRFARLYDEAQGLRENLELRVSERTAELRRQLTAIEVASDGMAIIAADTTLDHVNGALAAMLGRDDPAALRGLSWRELLEPSERARLVDTVVPLLRERGRWRGEVAARRQDGVAFPAELSVAMLEEGGAVAVIRDISERQHVQRLKTEFISTVSHELRTPLTAMQGALSLLAGTGTELDQQARDLLQLARSNGGRMLRLVEDLLDIQALEVGRLDFRSVPVAIRETLERALELATPLSHAPGVHLELGDCPEVRVRADPDRLLQAVGNVLSNALKFSPADGRVLVRAGTVGDSVRIDVTDEGPGIPPEFHERVFERFAQADSSNTRAQGGTGIGLYVSRRVLEQLGGSIDFECPPEGGTRFRIELPLLHAGTDA